MVSRFHSALGIIAHRCSAFANYFIGLQSRCFKSGRSEDCEGNPTLDEARSDFREMMRLRHRPF